MHQNQSLLLFLTVSAALAGSLHLRAASSSQSPATVTPADLPRIAEVDARFQSYNIEMLEVTGGNFWKPYSKGPESDKPLVTSDAESSSVPAGMDASMYRYRPPIDFKNSRMRKLAAALGPAYVRVSGTWANTTYFHDSDRPAPKTPPAGFSGVLTRHQWKEVVDFAHAADAKIVTSVAISPGTRDAKGLWTPIETEKVLTYTKSIGGEIAAAEFMNEPTFARMGGAPEGYDPAAYGRDLAVFRPYMKKAAPEIIILGPGSVGEGGRVSMLQPGDPTSEELLKAGGPAFDAFSYHFYGAVSLRGKSFGPQLQTSPEAALSEEWLSRTIRVEEYYSALRDRFAPGKPLWITETADAAAGGNPWASTFRDSFRYINQLGAMARRGVRVVAHNTLDASDYGLLDENTYEPRPNYWAALLWRRCMGEVVLDAGHSPSSTLMLYAHNLRGVPGGVALVVINTDESTAQSLTIEAPGERFTLSANSLSASTVQLNGSDLKLGADDVLPDLHPVSTKSGPVTFGPASITFLTIRGAGNRGAR
jgi:heparanase 1